MQQKNWMNEIVTERTRDSIANYHYGFEIKRGINVSDKHEMYGRKSTKMWSIKEFVMPPFPPLFSWSNTKFDVGWSTSPCVWLVISKNFGSLPAIFLRLKKGSDDFLPCNANTRHTNDPKFMTRRFRNVANALFLTVTSSLWWTLMSDHQRSPALMTSD